MGKFRKKLKNKIHQNKSNRMFILVIIGLSAVFIAFFTLISFIGTPKDKAGLMNDTLEYLKKTTGITEIKTFPKENQVIVVFSNVQKKRPKADYIKIARFGGIRLSNRIGDTEITVFLAEDTENNFIYRILVLNGSVKEENIIKK